MELGQLGLLLVVELLVRVRHGLPTRACNVFSVITESSQYKSSGRPKLVLESLKSVSSFSYIQVFKIVKPRIFEMLELCMSGQVFKIFLRSSLAQIMNAFIGLCEHVVRIFKQILDSLLLPRVHCLLRSIKISDQSNRYLDMWSSVSLSFWLSDDLGAIFAWGAPCLIVVVWGRRYV